MTIALVGSGERASLLARMLFDLDNVHLAVVCAPRAQGPAARAASELGVFLTTELTDVFQAPGLDLIVDMRDGGGLYGEIELQSPPGVSVIADTGSELLWDLLVAKKHSQEQERLFVELQVAYDKIRGHEVQLQTSKEALERANNELEGRLAEIFFTHEFFKALTTHTSVDDVCSLVVDGCNGILGAEISCVYLLNRDDWTLRLHACQGRAETSFRASIPVAETILGKAFAGEALQEPVIEPNSETAAWAVYPREIQSQAAFPLHSGPSVLGVMVMASSVRRELSPMEMDRLDVLCNQASLSLQNAILHGELQRLSVTDPLTQLYNHGYFRQRLEEEFNRSVRYEHEMSLIMLDIDGFKEFNDSYGHLQGDEVLKSVASVVRSNLRDIDIAARYGGEEFVVVLPETDCDGAVFVAERIRSGVERVGLESGGDGGAGRTVSVGVATFPKHGQSALTLVEAADVAMYSAKRAGKNRVHAAGC